MGYNKDIPTYRIYDRTNGEIVSFCEQVQSKAPSSVVDDNFEGSVPSGYFGNVNKSKLEIGRLM